MKHLTKERVIDLSDYGLIDPDAIKYQLPEMDGYLEHDEANAGSMTHQESGYVQEIALEAGLKQSKNLWVDGVLALPCGCQLALPIHLAPTHYEHNVRQAACEICSTLK